VRVALAVKLFPELGVFGAESDPRSSRISCANSSLGCSPGRNAGPTKYLTQTCVGPRSGYAASEKRSPHSLICLDLFAGVFCSIVHSPLMDYRKSCRRYGQLRSNLGPVS